MRNTQGFPPDPSSPPPESQAETTNNNIQKRGQSKLVLQLPSFVVREMRVELTRRN